MQTIWKLFKFQLDNKYDFFKAKNFKKFFVSLFKNIVIALGITLGIFLVASKICFFLGIVINAEFMSIVLTATQVISLIFAVASTIKTLYLSKDNELLIVLPVSFNQLFISKIMMLYVTDLVFEFVYVLPILLTLGIIGKFSLYFYFMILIVMIITPVFNLAFASLISIPMMYIVKYFKKHIILSVISILAIVAVIFVFYMRFVSSISGAFNVAERQIETSIQINKSIKSIGSSIIMFYQLAKSMLYVDAIYVSIIFLAISLVLMVLCFLIIKPFYYKVATINNENTNSGEAKYKCFKKRKPFNELLLNEIRSVFRSPSYIFQYFLFPLFMPLIVYTYDKLLVTIAVNQAGQAMIMGSHILVLCIISLMSNIISSTAISREGGVFYIAKTTPISFYTQVAAKITFNAIFTFASILITTITTIIFTSFATWQIIWSSLAVIILSFGHICHSFDMDLQHPVLDWYDNSEISAISKNTTKSIIYALALSVIMCLIIVFFSTKSIYGAIVLTLVFSVFYCISRIRFLYLRTKYYYEKMEM